MDSLTFLRDPDQWPAYPLAPVVKHPYKSGIVLADGKAVVYEVNMYALETGLLGPQLEGLPTHTYNSYEEMIADGWTVD